MALYKDGNPVSGLNSIPRLTLAQYNALTVKPEVWIRTDAPESYKRLSADEVSYDSNNTVKDKLDSISDTYENFLAVGQRYLDTIQIKLKSGVGQYDALFSVIGYNAYGALSMVITRNENNAVSAQYNWNNNGTPTTKYTTGTFDTSTNTITLNSFEGSFINWNVFHLKALKGVVDTFTVTSHL